MQAGYPNFQNAGFQQPLKEREAARRFTPAFSEAASFLRSYIESTDNNLMINIKLLLTDEDRCVIINPR